MTQEQHPIAPPSEDHILKWSDEWFEAKVKHMTREKHLCMQAARWGADQELEACCSLMDLTDPDAREYLLFARRPKPPSLKEQALKALKNIDDACESEGFSRSDDTDIIRRALEFLPD